MPSNVRHSPLWTCLALGKCRAVSSAFNGEPGCKRHAGSLFGEGKRLRRSKFEMVLKLARYSEKVLLTRIEPSSHQASSRGIPRMRTPHSYLSVNEVRDKFFPCLLYFLSSTLYLTSVYFLCFHYSCQVNVKDVKMLHDMKGHQSQAVSNHNLET
jgi:hypothetical protein